MKIGFNLLLWTGHVVESDFATIEALKKAGFDGVEIPIFDPSDLSHYKKIGRFLKDNGLQCTAVTVCPDEAHNPVSPVPANRQAALEHLKKVIDCAHETETQVLCGPYYQVLGQFTGSYPTDTERAHAAEVHFELAGYAEKAGVLCAVETLNRFECHLLNTIADGAAHVARVNHPNCKTMYDTFHANIEEKDPLGVIAKYYDSIGHFHVSENDRGTPGKGHIDLTAAIQAFKKLGYEGWITIEAFGGALPELAAATRVWRDFFPNTEEVYTHGIQVIRDAWNQ